MEFNELINQLRIKLKDALPGATAHEMMRAHAVGGVIPDFSHKLPPRPGSVLILLYEDEGTIRFPLIKRPEYLGAHSGQVSFPGGKAEAGENTIETALREGEEEVGIHSEDVDVIGTLSDFFVIPSNFMVTPVVAAMHYRPDFIPDQKEVARIILGDIRELLNDQAMLQKEILAAGKFRMMAPHFEIDHEIVWGATAMMLNEFRMVLKSIPQ